MTEQQGGWGKEGRQEEPRVPAPVPLPLATLAPHAFLGTEVKGGGALEAGVKIHKDSQTEHNRASVGLPTAPRPQGNPLIVARIYENLRLFYIVALIPHTQRLAVLGTFQISDCGNKISFSCCLCRLYQDLGSVLVTFTFCLKSGNGRGNGGWGAEEKGAQVLGKAY